MGQLIHGTEAVRLLVCCSANVLLAFGGRENIVSWDTSTGSRLWTVDTKERILALGFDENDTICMATTIANYTLCWSVKSSEELEKFFVSDNVEDDTSTYQRPPESNWFLLLHCFHSFRKMTNNGNVSRKTPAYMVKHHPTSSA